MTNLDLYNNNSYSTWQANHLSIDETNDGQPLVHVPDSNGQWYHVPCLETKTSITPVSCSCGHEHCKHMQVVTAFYARIYKSNVEKEEQKVATPVVVAPATPVLHNQPQTSAVPAWLAFLPSSSERLDYYRSLAS